jgi:tetratricopeptide (TPR) repeat protein
MVKIDCTMSMMRFGLLHRELAERETRTVKVLERSPLTGNLPVDEYGFDELYCTDRGCDCRRVVISVLARHARRHVATINHAFEKPARNHLVHEQTFLDPLNKQSELAPALLELFVKIVLADPEYRRRLERHYRLFKKVVDNGRGGGNPGGIGSPFDSTKERFMNEKEARRRKRKQKKAQERKARTVALPPAVASPFAMEQMMRSMFGGGLLGGGLLGGGRRNAASEAQDLAYEAMEASSPQRALQLARRALELNPRCVDALLIVARASGGTGEQLIEQVRAAVRAGEEELGKGSFEDNRGHFWGVLETRPYMRARAFLAELLAKAGRTIEAVEHLEAMLELNPGDNQGLRYVLLGHYLTLDRLDGAERLFREFDDEAGAFFAWGRVLHRFLSGDQAAAQDALAEARKTNRFAEDYLSGRKRLPGQLPDCYGIGDENEGIVCAGELGQAWAKHPAAVSWLQSIR